MGSKETVEKIKARMQKDVKEVVADIKEMIAGSIESYAELKTVAASGEVGTVVADEVVPLLPLPWYVPQWVAKLAVKNAVDAALLKLMK